MSFLQRSAASICAALLAFELSGCANPGPPKPPSLQIPAVIRDLSAARQGDAVELQFTLPQQTSDGVSLRSPTLAARVCRAVETGVCVPIAASARSFPLPITPKTVATTRDMLPPGLVSGPPRLLTYRVELLNAQGRGAGFSDATYAIAGAAPARITELHAEGSRLGVVLRWKPNSDDAQVLIERDDLDRLRSAPSSAQSPSNKTAHGKFPYAGSGKEKESAPVVLLNAAGDSQARAAGSNGANSTLDTTAIAETPYRYIAMRRRQIGLSGHKLEVKSENSDAVLFTLHDTFPPPPPTDLSVAGFQERNSNGDATSFAVDLIWEPVQDEQLAGYKVYRQALRTDGAGAKQLLTSIPVKLPAFHDATASGSTRYRYSVSSIDLRGNESEAVTAVLEPQSP